jgi:hypothetical protein
MNSALAAEMQFVSFVNESNLLLVGSNQAVASAADDKSPRALLSESLASQPRSFLVIEIRTDLEGFEFRSDLFSNQRITP